MLKSLIASMLAAFMAVSVSGEYYRPAEYLWYLESVDLAAGMLSSQPMCKVLGKGTSFPIELTGDMLAQSGKEPDGSLSEIIVRRGMTGEVCAAVRFGKGEKFKLPYLPAGFYSLMFKSFSVDGSLVSTKIMCLNIIEDNVNPRPNPAGIAKDVFAASLRGSVLSLSGLPRSAGELSLRIIARDRFGCKVFEQLIPCRKGAAEEEIKLDEIHPGQLLHLSVELSSPGNVINKTELMYYRLGNNPEKKPDWQSIAKTPEPFSGPVIHENQVMKGPFERNLPGLDALVEGMKKRGSNMINLNFNWCHIEPVSGVYDWTEVDRYVEYFSRRGIAFGIIACGGIFNSSPYDVWGEWMMDSKGECQIWRNFCITSPASPKFKAAAVNFVNAFYQRYGDNPCFKSWTFSAQGLDSGVFMDHFDRVTDYSPWARRVFTDFLKQRYHSLEELNRAWNSDFKTWEKVMPPLPDWSKTVDISRPWLDFSECKLMIYLDADVRLYGPVVRALDSKSKLCHYLTYTGPIEYAFPDMLKYGSHLNDGGGEAHQMVRLYAIAANWDIRRQPESHYVPADKQRQLQDMITNSLRYGFINYDLGTVWNSQVNLHAERYPKNIKLKESMEFWATIIPVLRTLDKSRPLAPPVGFVLSWDDVFCRTRAWRWYALPGETLQKAAAGVSLGNVPWLSGITPPKVYDGLKLIVCSSDNQVFSQELLNRLETFVRNGGNLLLCGNAGEYTVGSPEKFLWRTRLQAPSLSDSATIAEWGFGSGRVFYRAQPETADGTFLTDVMRRCNIGREVGSSNPEVQAFLLRNGNGLVLVVSAFKGFDRLRQLTETAEAQAGITLPSLPDAEWRISGLYPASPEKIYSSYDLKHKGIDVKIAASGIIIYSMEKVK